MAQLDRDAVMYEAGWAAAEAKLCAKRGRLWPATSGVLAASVMVLATLLVDRGETPPVAHNTTLAAREGLTVTPPVLQVRRFSPTDQSLLAVRERALRGEFPEPTQTVEQGTPTRHAPVTQRDLLEELLEGKINS